MGHPTFMYRRKDGGIDAQIFDSDDLPEGWVDHPDKAEDAGKEPEPADSAPKKRGPKKK